MRIAVYTNAPAVRLVHFSVAVDVGCRRGTPLLHQIIRPIPSADGVIDISELQIFRHLLIKKHTERYFIEKQRDITCCKVNLAFDGCLLNEAL